MKTYWLKFTDGSASHCQGQSAYDAQAIAEHLTGKRIAESDEYRWRADDNPNIQPIPYPASPMIWEFDHPVNGKTPHFCFGGSQCHGLGSCPRSISCTE